MFQLMHRGECSYIDHRSLLNPNPNPQLERDGGRPLDRGDEGTSVDPDPNR